MQAIQNLGLAAIALLAGLIVDQYGYLWLEVFFIFWLSLTTVASVMLWLVDMNENEGYLNMSVKERKVREEQLNEAKKLEETHLLADDDAQHIY
jgi:nitrate/nitrite transporter NarK